MASASYRVSLERDALDWLQCSGLPSFTGFQCDRSVIGRHFGWYWFATYQEDRLALMVCVCLCVCVCVCECVCVCFYFARAHGTPHGDRRRDG